MRLKEIDTLPPKDKIKEEVLQKTEEYIRNISDLQDKLFARKKHSILILLQGVDTAGKDGTIKHVFGGINPQGCYVKSWTKPNSEEMQFDFLWRIHKHVPPKGMIHIHNRSHYEDVLMPKIQGTLSDKRIEERMESIRDFEKHLSRENETVILKFFLHISKEEQRERIQERLSDPDKNWKYDPSDQTTQDRWDDYQSAYEMILNDKNQTKEWNLIPADKKWFRNHQVAKILRNELEKIVSLKND
ncbi:polyphosphate:nucleotide phosphotransferase, PPK2 family [Leptospira weilii serovar Ranarum str. ICFT]|uniref:Polyphosphate:nucleotide phosphotransferase, PPK2 family n=1 Tax=Leptospira weilii serovar Ranarum str. ICFT TaxID=1218598 RepID=N1WQI9_9LEPT|nr:PPK2 family polyphosphate--nucleotide phosphotransferase [Leptospira weilii]EMY79502.1 polyphosphate:nucleotide phosphotransferase, PPK2 family [Leptospira weilii serovar Ranarum str. ICFT]